MAVFVSLSAHNHAYSMHRPILQWYFENMLFSQHGAPPNKRIYSMIVKKVHMLSIQFTLHIKHMLHIYVVVLLLNIYDMIVPKNSKKVVVPTTI